MPTGALGNQKEREKVISCQSWQRSNQQDAFRPSQPQQPQQNTHKGQEDESLQLDQH